MAKDTGYGESKGGDKEAWIIMVGIRFTRFRYISGLRIRFVYKVVVRVRWSFRKLGPSVWVPRICVQTT